ncbi:MAG: uncharacterized protein A8A55_2216 [Amphiamblys sp. WSBS2006]|nr:MAG: uncharacterized protein A8A55_2216 [Amphiamblys sp. WSBS2006]
MDGRNTILVCYLLTTLATMTRSMVNAKLLVSAAVNIFGIPLLHKNRRKHPRVVARSIVSAVPVLLVLWFLFLNAATEEVFFWALYMATFQALLSDGSLGAVVFGEKDRLCFSLWLGNVVGGSLLHALDFNDSITRPPVSNLLSGLFFFFFYRHRLLRHRPVAVPAALSSIDSRRACSRPCMHSD